MIVTYKDFHKLRFPLFPLPNSNWIRADGMLFLDGRVLDDTKMPGETLGVRRLQCGRRDLHPLKRAIVDIPALLHCKQKNFIDSKGKVFLYDKTYASPLIAYKIHRIEKKEVASLLWLHGINYPITIPRPPLNNPGWVRLLHLGPSPWLLYDYVRGPTRRTYRRV